MANRRPREVERPTRKRSNKTKKKSDFFDYSLLFIVLFFFLF